MDDFIGRRNPVPPKRLREPTPHTDRKGRVKTQSHFETVAVTGTGSRLVRGPEPVEGAPMTTSAQESAV